LSFEVSTVLQTSGSRDHADHDRRVAVGRELGPVDRDEQFFARRDEPSGDARQEHLWPHVLIGEVAVELLDTVLVDLATLTRRRPSDGSHARPIGAQSANHAVGDRLALNEASTIR
jgi:hypothetical protein